MKITGYKTHLVRLPGAPSLADIPDKADQYTVRHAAEKVPSISSPR